MSRVVWVTSAVLVAGRATADMLGTGDLDARHVAALILVALLVTALAAVVIKRGE